MPRLINHLLIGAFLLVCQTGLAVAQDGRVIAKIEFEGLQQIAVNEAIATSGLKTAQAFKVDDVDAAAQRLLDSGLFARVGYRTRTAGNQITITFKVEEVKGGDAPVVFDNFIWFSDEQLLEAVRKAVPTFSSTVPSGGKMPATITSALQQLLEQNNLPGTVEYLASQSESGRPLSHVFAVKGVKLQVCTLHFPGVKNVTEDRLRAAAQELNEAEYARELVKGFADVKLRAVYRELGQLRAMFGTPIGKPDPKCKNGVDVTVPVEEGLIYSWGPIDWAGATKLLPDELAQLVGVKQGEVANGLKLDKGLQAVRKAYTTQGYMEAMIKPIPKFDDSTKKAAYTLEVNEGPQYRMGSLIFSGMTERDAKALRSAWRLQRGEPFNQTYVDEFFRTDGQSAMRRIVEERQSTGQAPPRVSIRISPNKATLTADVTLELQRFTN